MREGTCCRHMGYSFRLTARVLLYAPSHRYESTYHQGRKEVNVLFNNALNTFYLWLYGIGHMVKDHSDGERGNLCCHMGYSFRLAARVLLYAPSHRQDSTYLGLVTPVMEHWLEREIAQWVHAMKDRSDDPSHHERTLLPQSYISLP